MLSRASESPGELGERQEDHSTVSSMGHGHYSRRERAVVAGIALLLIAFLLFLLAARQIIRPTGTGVGTIAVLPFEGTSLDFFNGDPALAGAVSDQ